MNLLRLIIVAIHLTFVLILLIAPPFAFRKKSHKPLIVKTVTIKPPPVQIASVEKRKVSATALPAAPAPQKTAVQAPPPPAVKKAVKKSPTPVSKKEPAIANKTLSQAKPKSAPPPSPPRAKISDSLIRELEESIAKIENKSDKGTARSRKISVAPIALQIDMTDAFQYSDAKEGDYTDLLVSHLHQYLTLPEYGEVKIQLSLQQDGTVGKIVVLKAESEKNKKYLESNLPRLRFPRFEGSYAKKKESTFILTFCNG